jgi:hypothetical protein
MFSESGKVLSRRFTGRIVESGLLILAVALGVGAASSGFSLFGNTVKAGNEMLSSVEYRELVVSTRSSAEEMTVPVIKKPASTNVAITAADLDAAALAPAVAFAYVQNRDNLEFINATSLAEEETRRVEMQAAFATARAAASTATASTGTASARNGSSSSTATGASPTAGVTVVAEGTTITGEEFGPPGGMSPEGMPPERMFDASIPSAAFGTTGTAGTASTSTGTATTSGTTAPAGATATTRTAANAQSDGRGFQRVTAEDLAKAKEQADIVVVEDIERLNGFRVTSQFFDAWKMEAAYGSLLTDADASSTTTMVILGAEVAEKIAGDSLSPADLIGKKLLVRQGYVQVAGVLAATGESEFDDSFFSPYRTLATGSGGMLRMMSFNTQLRFTVSDVSKLEETEDILAGWFESKLGEGQVSISNPRSEAQKLIDRNKGISLLILFLSISGLFIALVNVSHILMSRGLRMKRSVGVMMALGASRQTVLKLFAFEATAVSATGSILGGIFAIPISGSMQSALGLTDGSWIFVVLGVLVSWALTMAFSVAPAYQNSRIVPADAMRAA